MSSSNIDKGRELFDRMQAEWGIEGMRLCADFMKRAEVDGVEMMVHCDEDEATSLEVVYTMEYGLKLAVTDWTDPATRDHMKTQTLRAFHPNNLTAHMGGNEYEGVWVANKERHTIRSRGDS